MSELKCNKCNKQVDSSVKFCPQCGASIKPESAKVAGIKSLSRTTRDTLMVVAFVSLITAGFFIFKKPHPIPQSAGQPVMGHGQTGDMGVNIADLPKDYDGLVQTGDRFMDQNNFPVAAECYKRALVIDGSSPDVRTDFGACLYGMGLADRAIEEFHQVLQSHQRHGIAVYNLGVVYYGLKVADSSVHYFNRYLGIEPNGKASGNAKRFLKELGA